MRYDTILFDLDGTLTDSAPGIINCVVHALECLGAPEQDRKRLTCFVGPPLIESFQIHCGFDAATASKAVAHYRERYTDIGIFENTVYDGIPEMLSALRQEEAVRLIVATAKPTGYAQRILDHFSLSQYFDSVVGAELNGSLIHKDDILREALCREGLPADRLKNAVMVGDREHDILAAHSHAIASIGVSYGYGSPEELRLAGPTHLAHSPEQVAALLHG